jgi:tRNA/tmRNA/rRNA uracil-C5-methylase (TrmA/RlmC/RlmD family)
VTETTDAAGPIIDLDITDVAHGGVFVGRHEGRVVFVPDTLPGERVRVRLDADAAADGDTRRFWRAEVLEVLDAAPARRPHIWRAADVDTAPEDRPGGADFGHIALDEQRALKLRVLQDALARIGRLDVPASLITATDAAGGADEPEREDATGWRTRVSLHVDAAGRVGPFAARSHRVIEVDDLPLAVPGIARVAAGLGAAAEGRIDLVQPADGRVRVLGRPDARPRGQKKTPDPAREVVVERAGGRDFRVDAGGFWQVHRLAADALTTVLARELAGAGVDPDGWHLDLYGGVGLFAATLADAAGSGARVTSVEADERATEHAGTNLAQWLGARAETGRVDRWVAQLAARASDTERERLSRGVVVLDPPRAGARAAVVRGIAALNPAAVVYIACDPVALARDMATFRDEGYEAAGVQGIDLFPHSHHVEAVTTLIRTGGRR